MEEFITKEILDELSYHSGLKGSLKQISLRKTPVEEILEDISNNGGFRQCFNDVLGFRLWYKEYPTEFPDYFRVVDLRNGKQIDDGYRAIHLYYQKDNKTYPIEIQLWCEPDYTFNIWSHRHIYKYREPEVGKRLHDLYINGDIKSEEAFLERMEEMEALNE